MQRYKKICSIFLLLIINILIFANKKTYDEAKYRQDVLKYSLAQVGKKYSQANRMGANSFDCSSLVDRASQYAGMNSVTGANTKKWSGTTATMKKSVKRGNINNLKAGDVLYFNGHVGYVVENYGNGKVKMVHAANKRKGVVVETISLTSGYYGRNYVGSISATDVLINNGYTPVNSNGEIIIPPAGETISADVMGNISTELDLEEKYEVSWDEMVESYKNMIFEGLNKIMEGLLVLLTLLTILQIMMLTLFHLTQDNMGIINEIIALSIKYIFFFFVISNYEMIIYTMYDIFAGIGSLFLKNNEIKSLDQLFSVGMKEITKILSLINQYEFNIIKLIVPGYQILDKNLYKVFMLVCVLIMTLYFTIKIIFELMVTTIQYYLSFGLSFIYFSLTTNDITKHIGRRPLKTLIGSGLRVVVTIMFSALIYGILDKAGFGEVTLETVRLEAMLIFITSSAVLGYLMNKTNNIIYLLNS